MYVHVILSNSAPADKLLDVCVCVCVQSNPLGYQADSKVNEGVLGHDLWNAAQVGAHPASQYCYHACVWQNQHFAWSCSSVSFLPVSAASMLVFGMISILGPIVHTAYRIVSLCNTIVWLVAARALQRACLCFFSLVALLFFISLTLSGMHVVLPLRCCCLSVSVRPVCC